MQVNEKTLLENIKASKIIAIDVIKEPQVKEQLLSLVDVDLTSPNNEVAFAYQIFLREDVKEKYPNMEFWGIIETTAEWAILMYQEAINTTYELIWSELSNKPSENPPKLELNGVFDCNTATATLMPAQIVRGTGVGRADYWPLGWSEFNWCMSNSEILKDIIEINNQELTADEFDKNFEPVLSVNVPEDRFVSLPIPDHCEGIKPTSEVGITTSKQQEGWAWPIFLGTMSGLVLVGMVYYAFSDKFKTPPLEEDK